jgi:plastocyanin
MSRSLALLAVIALALAAIAAAPASSRTGSSASLVIRHQQAHCHAWSLNGGPYRAAQKIALATGSQITVTNDDVMPHSLVKLAGPSVTMHNSTVMPMMRRFGSQTPGVMNHMGASTTVTFSKPGVYRFRTRAGEDYMSGIETTGADNVLTLTVTVK